MRSDQRAGSDVSASDAELDGFASFAREMGWSQSQEQQARRIATLRAMRGLPAWSEAKWAEWAGSDAVRTRPDRLTPAEPSAVYVRFEYGFGTNVYIGLDRLGELGLSLSGWEHLCELVDQYRAITASSDSSSSGASEADTPHRLGPVPVGEDNAG